MPRTLATPAHANPPGLPMSKSQGNENHLVWEHVLLLLESYQLDIARYTKEAEQKAISAGAPEN